MNKYEIHFTNTKFFVSDNTVLAFYAKIWKLDKKASPYGDNGTIKNGRILYIKSETITAMRIREMATEFVKKYDHLSVTVLNKTPR